MNDTEMFLEPDWSFEEFLSSAGRRLNLPQTAVKKAFHPDGERTEVLRRIARQIPTEGRIQF
jgi:hypothetical protein